VQPTASRPRAAAAAPPRDRGYSVSSVFEHNTRRGIASVFPWRASGSRLNREQEDCDTHDRHGVVRCKHCGAPTRLASFAKTAGVSGTAENGETTYRGPRLYVLCEQPVTEACQKRQSIACETSWRMLLPLWRTDPTYLALRHSHDRYERVHHHWRVRWRSGADDHSLRPKRRGRDCQQLRAPTPPCSSSGCSSATASAGCPTTARAAYPTPSASSKTTAAPTRPSSPTIARTSVSITHTAARPSL